MQKVYADKSLNIPMGDFEKPEEPLSVEIDCSKYKQPGNLNNNLINEEKY